MSQKSHRLLTPTTNPIPLLSSPLTQRYSIAHTLVVPLYYYIRGTYLIADPFITLLRDLAVVAVLQCAFCAVCLPQAGAWVSGTSGGPILEGTSSMAGRAKGKGAVSGTGSLRRKNIPGAGGSSKGAGEGNWRGRIMPTLFSLILTLTLPPLPLTLLALVLGAPLYPTSSLPLTLLLSLHVSLLAFLPLFYTHGVSATAWRDISAAWLPFDGAGAWGGSVGTFVGGWIGAIPIALDWDRDWQAWPCTVVWGVVAGWMVGRLLTGVLGWGVGRRIDLSEKEEEEIVLVERRDEVGAEKED
ncbi:Glycosylphosphatidylinositol (GPI) anchor assembly protein [Cladophialophora chaetospira]|uniref:Glycosylphosphatidylinositol (GPI) anchor assembly protein n=1 Tax=Cladophialophora chaetospira TaxID=386627 RepID=A0AA38WXS9_9EURO|nr:Glycosylphosphatidylinositol (GPI) anchor assembly protein [Cladophialophora chaetospira]